MMSRLLENQLHDLLIVFVMNYNNSQMTFCFFKKIAE